MASLTGTSNSSVLKIMLVATVITPVTVILTLIWLTYTYGGTAFANNAWVVNNNQFFMYSDPARYGSFPASNPIAPYVLAGIVIVAILEYLHARFVWFPFNAIGFIMGTTYVSVLFGYWGPFLIAWVLKTITLRVGGSKAYENVGVPIASGFISGYMIAVIVGGILGVVRFFIPY